MSEHSIKTRIKHRINSRQNWESPALSGSVLFDGEIAFIRNADGNTCFKVGDGVTPFANLPYVSQPALSGDNNIVIGTRQEWAATPDFQPYRGQIVIWSNRGVEIRDDGAGSVISVDVPGFKVGDGNAYNIDLPFVGDDAISGVMNALAEHARSASHLSAGERESWNHKITIGSVSDPNDDGVDGETLIITRN